LHDFQENAVFVIPFACYNKEVMEKQHDGRYPVGNNVGNRAEMPQKYQKLSLWRMLFGKDVLKVSENEVVCGEYCGE